MDEQEIVQEGTEEVLEAEAETTDVPADAPEAEEVDWEARAKAAEALIVKNKQEAKAAKKEVKTETVAPQPANVEEVVLKANGMEDEVLEKLKTVARANGTDLLTAQKDDLFQAWETKHKADQKKAAASLGASNGSGKTSRKPSFSDVGLSDDDHKAMFQKRMNG